ncbi:M24 family metallopeptidase [Geosporobacter ferrireducens]|uniref:Xaa-Pro dipeptidase n=1 Tax=Geosporobacter ferrireducens TaxID=1424294 RepID=A0A1D8GHL9_9FIRM|nr:M24 family metallopeptidase [Geosporobacter ferrireducens]AOT70384.1 Xaa-Pro dipeptidase [Geosporobacter ferrireducens]
MQKILKIRKLLKSKKIEAILIASSYNKFYLANLYSGSGYVFVTKRSQYVIVDFRYYKQVKEDTKGFTVIEQTRANKLENILNKIIHDEEIRTIGFEGDYIVYDAFSNLDTNLEAQLVPVSLEALRCLKSTEEIHLIAEAAEITDKAFSHILDYIQCGMSEKQVENELVRCIRECGGIKESFDIIVASGERGALPHGKASDKKICAGELVTIDFGVNLKHYCSDMTRTFAMGYVKDAKLVEIYEVVKRAQEEAIKQIRSGIRAGEIDAAARSIIQAEGYGEYFGHNLGHGMGIMVHEYPALCPDSSVILEAGMVVTVEPGIYIPQLGGVRIEDDILVTKEGAIPLTKSPRELIIVKG